jgi:hypothetical protein
MGAVAIDLNNSAEVITIGRRALVDALGADGARVFLNTYAKEGRNRPKIAPEELARIKTEAMAEALTGRGKGIGDYTAEKYEQPDQPFDEYAAELRAATP